MLFCFSELVGLEKEGLSFVALKADTKLKTKIVLWTIFTTRPEGEVHHRYHKEHSKAMLIFELVGLEKKGISYMETKKLDIM